MTKRMPPRRAEVSEFSSSHNHNGLSVECFNGPDTSSMNRVDCGQSAVCKHSFSYIPTHLLALLEPSWGHVDHPRRRPGMCSGLEVFRVGSPAGTLGIDALWQDLV